MAYVATAESSRAEADELRAWLATRLPAAFVPHAVVPVPALPRMPNGKLDRQALPGPPARSGPVRVPSGRWEEMVAQAFGSVLDCEVVGATDDFFDLGGHSLAAAQLAARLTGLSGTVVEVREVFEASTVELLARRLAQERPLAEAIRRQPRRAV